MPPLRDRREDIVLLANSFLQEFAKENERPVKPLSDAAMQLLLAYSWPGNVRELRTAIEHGVVMCNDPVIEVRHLPQFVYFQDVINADSPSSPKMALDAPGEFNLHSLETSTIRAALSLAGGNRTHAADLLGVSRRTLQRKLKDLGL
jgi:DNA-binding NtrC family response regulator